MTLSCPRDRIVQTICSTPCIFISLLPRTPLFLLLLYSSNLSLVLLVPHLCLSLQGPPASICSSLGCPRYCLHLQFSILASVLEAGPGISGFTVSFPDMVPVPTRHLSLLPSYPPFIPLIARSVYRYCHACIRSPRKHSPPPLACL